MGDSDPCQKLRPLPFTPQEERCSCCGVPPIILSGSCLSYNPVRCFDCGGEVEPSRIGFPEKLAESIAFWNRMYGSIDYLWLESREYEKWAVKELFSPDKPPNSRGLLIRQQLEHYRKCYYWWFQDVGAENFKPLSLCPLCNRTLTQDADKRVCEDCRIVLRGEQDGFVPTLPIKMSISET